jgi:DNA-directed RNA polymerase subunit F
VAKKIVKEKFVILSEAKDLLSRAQARKQVFRFAQDDKR